MMLSHGLAAGLVKSKYATWDSTRKNSKIALSGGDTIATFSSATGGVCTNISKTTGKWYWEITVNSGLTLTVLGFWDTRYFNNAGWPGSTADGGGWQGNGSVYASGTVVGTVATFGSGDVLGFALDATGTIGFYKNGAFQATYSIPANPWTASVGSFSSDSGSLTANFGASPFAYTPPSGYNAGLY